MAGNVFAKIGPLSRLIIRQDRIRIPLWIVGIILFTIVTPVSFSDLYGTEEQRAGLTETMRNPVMTAMVGPGDLENYTLGVMTAHQMLLITAVVVGLMSVLLVIRHTRIEEEDGRIEIIRALPSGRLSHLNAALAVISGTNILLALVIGFGLYALGIESIDLEGSLLYGAVLGATGLVFTGVAALFAQLSESSRGAVGFSIAVLLITYLVRAIGDVSNPTLSMISPLGWIPQAEVYAANHWWPVLLLVGLAILLFVVANYLNAIRDLGQGFLPTKRGRKYASRFLQTPIGLALRLQRTGIISWAIGMIVLGSSYGSVLGDLEAFVAGNEMMEQMLAQSEGYTIIEQFIPMLMMVMVLLATIPPLMAINKLYGEENKNRIDHILGRAVSRTRLMGSYILIAIANGFLMVSLAAIGLWSAGTAAVAGGIEFGPIYAAAMIYLPAILVMIGVAICLIGIIPRLTSFIWMYLVYSFIVLYLGSLFQFPDWASKLSPFGYVPQIPIEEFELLPVTLLIVVAIVLMFLGLIGYNRRDMK